MTAAVTNTGLLMLEELVLLEAPLGIILEGIGRLGNSTNVELIGRVFQVAMSYSAIHLFVDCLEVTHEYWFDIITTRSPDGFPFTSSGAPLILAGCVMTQVLPVLFKSVLGEHHLVTRVSKRLGDLVSKIAKVINLIYMMSLVAPIIFPIIGCVGIAATAGLWIGYRFDPRFAGMF